MANKLADFFVRVGADIKGFERGMTDVQKSMKTVGTKMAKVGKTLSRNVTLPIVALGFAAVKAFADFDKAMVESLAIMGNVSAGLRSEMEATARDMSTKSTFAAKELAESYFFLASAGMDAAQSIKALPVVAAFAQAGAFNLATATDLLTDAQTALGLSSKDAEENQRNLIKVSDVLVKANTLANASVQQFAEALTNKAAAALSNVNKELEEGVAILAAYADKGVKGQLAGQRLTMMFNGLFDATSKQKQAWKDFGISIWDSTGQMRGMGDIIGEMEVAFKDMSPEAKTAALEILGFNIKTKDSILTLLGSSEKIKQWTKDLKNAGGITKEVADKQMKAFSNQMKVMVNNIVNAAASMGEVLAPGIRVIAKLLSGATKAFTEMPKSIKVVIAVIATLAAVVGPLLLVMGKLSIAFAAGGSMAGVFAAGLAVLKTAFTALLGPIGAVAAAATVAVVIFNKLRKAQEEAEAAADRNATASERMEKKLRKLTDAAGLTRAEMIKLKNKYDWNTLALLSAIKAGKEGVELQEAMTKVGKENTKAIEEQKKATEDLEGGIEDLSGTIGDDLIPETEKWIKFIENIGLKTIQEQTERTETLEAVLKELEQAYKDGRITLVAYGIAVKKAKDELQGFSEEIIDTAIPATRDMAGVIEQAVDEINGKIPEMSETFRITFVEIGGFAKDLIDGLGNSFGNFFENVLNNSIFFKNEEKKALEAWYKDEKKILDDRYGDRVEFEEALIKLNQERLEKIRKVELDWYEDRKQLLKDKYGDSKEYQKALVQLNQERADKIREIEEVWYEDEKQLLKDKYGDSEEYQEALIALNQERTDKIREIEGRLGEDIKNLWRDIKASLARIFADMAQDYLTNFVKNILSGSKKASKAMEDTGKVFKNVGDAVAGIGEGIGKMIEGLAKGIGKAIEALATSIANAARSLAAAAPQLMIVGAIALALFAGFKAIQSLFGGGGKKDQSKATEMLQDIRNKTFDIFNGAQWMWKTITSEQQSRLELMIERLEWIADSNTGILGYVTASKDYLQKIEGYASEMLKQLRLIPKGTAADNFATGGAFIPPSPMTIQVDPGELVDISPLSEITRTGRSRAGLTMPGSGGGTPIINIEMEPIIIQRDNEIVINIVRKGLDKGQLLVPIKAVGG